MRSRVILAILCVISIIASGQRSPMELAFTAINNTTHAQLDSIKVMNRTQGVDTVLYWPDTVLTIYFVGIPEPEQQEQGFQVFQNYPNPVTYWTNISLYVPGKDEVRMIVTDMMGRVILKSERVMGKGIHTFRFVPGNGNLFFFFAQWRSNSSSIKILNTVSGSKDMGSLEYLGNETSSQQLKSAEDTQSFSFVVGDELLYIGYDNGKQTGILDAPEVSETYTFQFATSIPCPGTPTVLYEGQLYHTIQIFSQCWLKENLNVGTMISCELIMTNNNILEKFCLYNSLDTCLKFGAFYKWWEVMQYIDEEGTQGICPPGWHIPTDGEWKVLEGSVDGHFGVGDPNWDIWGPRGIEAGSRLKATHGWVYGGNGTDQFGFSGLAGGKIWGGGNATGMGSDGYWWTSTEINSSGAWSRQISYDYQGVTRLDYGNDDAFNVRCVKDY
jgi:uncharacterized protein (TIGR02145 family)